ncbi:Abi family protein [Caviibacter abscessus]|uniref:Abi family protein n=1 Tax=Caviibacter abscessus TaxID=1766719 RepID=UPI0009E66732|nr:Abi family protein [Caviibacter abscessus]
MNEKILNTALAYISDDENLITKMANISAVLMENLTDINWVGFYLVEGNFLVLGPFQGKPACTKIPFGKGVCGTAWEQRKTLIVDNVHNFATHIACDSASNSEIVVPIFKNNEIIAVLDIDSPIFNRFNNEDKRLLEILCKNFDKKYTKLNKKLLSEKEFIGYLENKNLKFKDKEKAITTLKHISYYKLKEFSYKFINSQNKYLDNIYFEDILDRFFLDKKLRLKLLDAIEIIEISVKINIAKILGKEGLDRYMDTSWWIKQSKNYKDIRKKLENKNKSILNEESEKKIIDTYKNKYSDDENTLSILIFIEDITWGELIYILEACDDTILQQLCSVYSIKKTKLINFLSAIRIVRNRASHNNNIIDNIYLDRYSLKDVTNFIKEFMKTINPDYNFENINKLLTYI